MNPNRSSRTQNHEEAPPPAAIINGVVILDHDEAIATWQETPHQR